MGFYNGKIRVIGQTINNMDQENYTLEIEVSMKVNLALIKHMDVDFIHGLISNIMKDNGNTIK